MAVKVKMKKVESGKDTIITFNSEDYTAVEGLKGSGFEGKVKAIHKHHAKTLLNKKLVKEVKAEVVKEENPNRSSKDAPKN